MLSNIPVQPKNEGVTAINFKTVGAHQISSHYAGAGRTKVETLKLQVINLTRRIVACSIDKSRKNNLA